MLSWAAWDETGSISSDWVKNIWPLDWDYLAFFRAKSGLDWIKEPIDNWSCKGMTPHWAFLVPSSLFNVLNCKSTTTSIQSPGYRAIHSDIGCFECFCCRQRRIDIAEENKMTNVRLLSSKNNQPFVKKIDPKIKQLWEVVASSPTIISPTHETTPIITLKLNKT